MKIALTSITVKDQQQALEFYTEKLGFVKKEDEPMGEYRWLTVVSAEGSDGVELLLEPMAFPPAVEFQKALYEAGIPATAFHTDDIKAEIKRLTKAGVDFRGELQVTAGVPMITFDDSCGNIICLVEKKTG